MPHAHVNDTSLYYEDDGEGRTLLLLHGWGTSARVWGSQQADLVADYRVVSLDWRGCGRSGRPAVGNSIAGVVADLAAVIAELRLDRPVVIGSSIGGVFATELALAHPDLVSGVIPVDGTAYWAAEGMDLDMLLKQLRFARPAFVADWVPHWYAPGASRALIDWTIRQILDSGPYIDSHVIDLATYDPRPRLPDLRVPIHYLHGELDPEIPVDVSLQCAARTPGAEVTIVPDSGHMPHQEQPAAFNQALREALNGLDDRTRSVGQVRPVAIQPHGA